MLGNIVVGQVERYLNGKLYLPEFWPLDSWECLFVMGEVGTKFLPKQLELEDISTKLGLYTNNVEELFYRMEQLIRCMNKCSDAPDDIEDQRTETQEIGFLDFFYTEKFSYMPVDEFMAGMVQKIAVLHYQFEHNGFSKTHEYYPYMMRTFGFVLEDSITVLRALIDR